MSNPTFPQPIRIDFLPAKYREEGAKRRLHVWRLSVTALLAVLLLLASWRQRTVRLALEQELTQVSTQCAAAEAQMQRLTEVQGQLVKRQGEAELVTFLRHPWPRSQVLAMLVEPLPASIRLSELHIAEETLKQSVPSPSERAAAKKKDAEAPLDPAKQDLKTLRDTRERSVTVVTLHGVASDVASLHIYLGHLAQHRLVAKAELKSIERGAGTATSESHFQARIELAAPYGHPEGPTPAEDAIPPVAERKASTLDQAAARRAPVR